MWWRLLNLGGIAALVLVFILAAIRFYQVGFSWPRLLAVIGVPILLAWHFWAVRQHDEEGQPTTAGDAEDKEPLVSIVLLLKETRFLDAAVVAAMASRAWGVRVSTSDDEYFAVGESPLIVVKAPAGIFLVHNHDQPYVPDVEELASQVAELRLRHALEQHQAWSSVDWVTPGEEPDRASAYRAIARLVAEFADENCLALLGTESGKMMCYSPELDERLRGDEPLAALDYHLNPPVIEIPDDYPEMAAAVAEAQRRWPEFVAAFESRDLDEIFSVKARIKSGDDAEFIWINTTAIEGDRIYGLLGNQPVALRGLNEGDNVSITVGEVNDWMYLKEGQPVGGFTVQVLAKFMKGGHGNSGED